MEEILSRLLFDISLSLSTTLVVSTHRLSSSSAAEPDAASSALGLPPPPPGTAPLDATTDFASEDEDNLLDFAGGGLDLANPFTDFGANRFCYTPSPSLLFPC